MLASSANSDSMERSACSAAEADTGRQFNTCVPAVIGQLANSDSLERSPWRNTGSHKSFFVA